MSLWVAIIAIVAVVTFGDIIKRVFDRNRSGDSSLRAEIEELKERVYTLETNRKGSVEERLSNIEKIVIDTDYSLNREIKKVLKKDD